MKFTLDFRGEFDELFIRGADIHIERMNETGFWIGIDLPDGEQIMINTGVHQGVWYFNVEEDKAGGRFLSVQRPRGTKPVKPLARARRLTGAAGKQKGQ